MANNRTLPFSKMSLPEGEEMKPGPRKDDKTNTALARSFLVDPAILARQVSETMQADPETGEPKKKSNAELQQEKLAEQAKAVELARYQAQGRGMHTASSMRASAAQSPDNHHSGSPATPKTLGTKTRFEDDGGGDTQKSGGMTKVNPLGLSQTGASMMSAQDTQIEKKTRKWETEAREGGALSGRLTETIITEHMDNLSKLEELEEHIRHISETKEKEREERKKRLQSMHIFERFDDVREKRILTRHEKRQREWDEFRERMVKKLGKEKDPDNLVINRAEEWRAMLEEKELLVKAKPIEQRQGSNVWQMSLRDAWTRYISVGGPFSGLEMPYIDRPELRPDSIYTIRNPFNNTEAYPDEVLIDPKTGQPKINPKTKQPYTRKEIGISVHPSMNLDKTRRSRATVPGEEPHKDGVKRANSKALTILKPAEVFFDGLCVEGAGFETRFEHERAEQEARLAEEERLRQLEEEKQRRKAANRGKTRGAQSEGAPSVKSASNTAVSAGADLAAMETSKGIEFEPWIPEEDAPLMSFEEDRLVMQTAKGKAGESVLSCMNVGNCAIYYSWSRVQVGVDSAKDAFQRFFMKDVSGSILPGKSKEFVFNFKSEKPGVFAEEWTFTGTPNVAGCQHKLLLKGICMAEDFTRAKRAELEARLAASQRDHTVEEIVNEVVEHIGTPRTKPRVLAEDPDVDRQVFIAQNKEAQIYYSNTTLKLFRSLADSTFELLNFPMELRKWDSSLNSLKRLLYAIEDDYERERHIVQFNEIMKNAGIPPTSTAMFNSICYELVSELADSIPDIAEGIRKKLALPKKNLQPKREEVEGEIEGAEFGKQGKIIMEEKILTYTTELPRPAKEGEEPPQDPMNLWHYDDHLLRIGGPPIEWFYLENEEKKPDYFVGTKEEVSPGAVREGPIKLKKKISVEKWENDGEPPKEEGEGEGEEQPDKPPEPVRDDEDTGRLEFEYLLRLNDAVYYNLATMTERMALLNVEADLRSQVIAQVVIELNDAAAEEIRTLIKEDKVDEARKIDPAKYQNIVDLDQIFRMVMKQETEAEAQRVAQEKAKEQEEALRLQQASSGAGGEPIFAAGGLNGSSAHAN